MDNTLKLIHAYFLEELTLNDFNIDSYKVKSSKVVVTCYRDYCDNETLSIDFLDLLAFVYNRK